MPTLPCPHCDHPLEVAASRAGSEIQCPACGQTLPVPKLGQLRQLAGEAEQHGPATAAGGTALGWRVAFVSLMAIAAIAAIVASYGLIRYAAITVPETTESHIEGIEEVYPQLPPGQLVREWQEMEKFRPEIAGPYLYQEVANAKARWLRQGLIALAIAAVAATTAIALIALRPRQA